MDVVETKELSATNLIAAMNRTFYGGEKFVVRIGEVEVGIVPLEEMEIPELLEK